MLYIKGEKPLIHPHQTNVGGGESVLFEKYSTEEAVNDLPSCQCGILNSQSALNKRCLYCGTVVTSPNEMLNSPYYFLAPKGFNFISLKFLMTIDRIVGDGSFRWMTDHRFDYIKERKRMNKKNDSKRSKPIFIPEHLVRLGEEPWFVRDYEFFMYNMINILETIRGFITVRTKKFELTALIDAWNRDKDEMMFRKLPLLPKALFSVKGTSKGKFTTPMLGDQLSTVAWYKDNYLDASSDPEVGGQFTSELLGKIMAINDDVEKDVLDKKEGWINHGILASRIPDTIRATITLITGEHKINEIHLPWTAGVNRLEALITRELLKDGMTPEEAYRYIVSKTKHYDAYLDSIMQDIMSRYKDGLPSFTTRNPTIWKTSQQLLRITKILTNPKEGTIKISPLALKPFAGDIDGDMLHFHVLPDEMAAEAVEGFNTWWSCISPTKPRKVSSAMNLTSPIIMVMDTWIGIMESRVEEDNANRTACPLDIFIG